MHEPLVANKYQLLRRIAQGGMAEIFLAKQKGLNGFEKLVVLKRILPHLAKNPMYVEMFLNEAKTAADLRHSNIAQTFEVGEDRGILFMVMEYVHGLDVRSVFKRFFNSPQEMPIGFGVTMAIDALAGLHYVHTKMDLQGKHMQIVHRDVSPQNLVVTVEGETKVVDFGIAQIESAPEASGVLKGKYSYMSPEQARGEPLDARSDQFAMGIVLYEMTCMKRLFKRHDKETTLNAIMHEAVPLPSRVRADYPHRLQTIILKALAKDPRARFTTCEEMRLALEDYAHQGRAPFSRVRVSQFLGQHFPYLKEGVLAVEPMVREEMSARFANTTRPSNTRAHAAMKKNALPLGALFLLLLVLAGLWRLWPTASPKPQVEPPVATTPEVLQPMDRVDAPPPMASAARGRLKVVVHPWADVYVNNIKIGSTPLAPHSLPAGEYEIRLANPDLALEVKKHITILPNEDTLVRHTFDAQS